MFDIFVLIIRFNLWKYIERIKKIRFYDENKFLRQIMEIINFYKGLKLERVECNDSHISGATTHVNFQNECIYDR